MTSSSVLSACGIASAPANIPELPPAQKTAIGPSTQTPIEVVPTTRPAVPSGDLFSFSEQWSTKVNSPAAAPYSMGTLSHRPVATNLSFYSDPAKGIYYTNRVAILTFHDMSPTLHSPWNMSATAFAADLGTLRKDQFHVISNQQFTGWLEHQNSVPDNAVLLTFDDGYASWFNVTLPLLQQNHMTGTFFNIVGFINMNKPGFLTWTEAEAMAHAGMSMESHTYNLHYLVDASGLLTPAFDTPITKDGKILTPAQDYERDYQDFSTAKKVLEAHVGTTVDQFAWPYGWGNWVATAAAVQSGYQFIYTTNPGMVTPWSSPLALPRIDAGYSNTTPQQMIDHILQTAGVPISANKVL